MEFIDIVLELTLDADIVIDVSEEILLELEL